MSLFSDVDCDKFPSNSPVDFRNSVPIPFDLTRGDYEVGLKDILFESLPPKQKKVTQPVKPTKVADTKGPIGDQSIDVNHKLSTRFEFEYPTRISFNGYVAAINEGIQKTAPHLGLTFQFRSIKEKAKIKVTLQESGGRWIELSEQLANLIGFKDRKITHGEHEGDLVLQSAYDDAGKPDLAELFSCHLEAKETVMKAPDWGVRNFINSWLSALEAIKVESIGIRHKITGDDVFLTVYMYVPEETMKLPVAMNNLLNLPTSYSFSGTTNIIVPKSKFEKPPLPPPPSPPPVYDPEKFLYVICDVGEDQIVGSCLVPALATLPREKDKKLIQQTFVPVSYVNSRRQLVSSIGVRITNRNLQNLSPSDVQTYCTLHFKRLQ